MSPIVLLVIPDHTLLTPFKEMLQLGALTSGHHTSKMTKCLQEFTEITSYKMRVADGKLKGRINCYLYEYFMSKICVYL